MSFLNHTLASERKPLSSGQSACQPSPLSNQLLPTVQDGVQMPRHQWSFPEQSRKVIQFTLLWIVTTPFTGKTELDPCLPANPDAYNEGYIFFFCHSMWLEGSSFPDWALNASPLQWKRRVLTTGLQGNFQGSLPNDNDDKHWLNLPHTARGGLPLPAMLLPGLKQETEMSPWPWLEWRPISASTARRLARWGRAGLPMHPSCRFPASHSC